MGNSWRQKIHEMEYMLTEKTAHILLSLKGEMLTKTDMEKFSTMEDPNRISDREDVINSSEDVQNFSTKVPKLPFAKIYGGQIGGIENIATGHGGGESNEI